MCKRKIIVTLVLTSCLLLGFNINKIISSVEQTLNRKSEEKGVEILKGIFDNADNLWLLWFEYDKIGDGELRGLDKPEKKHYFYQFVQKFNSKGLPYFQPIEIEKRIPYGDEQFGISSIFTGNASDVYFSSADGRLERIDTKGNRFTTNKQFLTLPLHLQTLFFDKNNLMYIIAEGFGGGSGIRKCTKAKIQDPLPVYLEEQQFPDLLKPGSELYYWLYSNLFYYDSAGSYALFLLPPILPLSPNWVDPPWVDTTKINVYHVNLPDMISIDTSSFRINEALYKKIKGCKLETNALIKGISDTLLLYLPSRGTNENLIYVCKLAKNGRPIKTKEIIEEEVKNFDKAPERLHREIVFKGGVTGNLSEPSGIMIYGFDKSGNVYYYVWDKSDDFWKGE